VTGRRTGKSPLLPGRRLSGGRRSSHIPRSPGRRGRPSSSGSTCASLTTRVTRKREARSGWGGELEPPASANSLAITAAMEYPCWNSDRKTSGVPDDHRHRHRLPRARPSPAPWRRRSPDAVLPITIRIISSGSRPATGTASFCPLRHGGHDLAADRQDERDDHDGQEPPRRKDARP